VIVPLSVAKGRHHAERKDLSWHGNPLVLAKIISRNLKVYVSRFGLERGQSTLRTSRGGHSYRFTPGVELLKDIKKEAEYERQNMPQMEFSDEPF
jgi:hypothetical protein